MAQFKYEALSHDGSTKKGTLSGSSQSEITNKLKEDGLFVTLISEVLQEGGDSFDIGGLFARVNKKTLGMFFRQLSVLLRSGVSIVHALNILQKQARGSGMKRMLRMLLADVEQGVDLSDAMNKHRCFSLYDVSMVKAAEESGELDVIMETVADQMEKNLEFKAQLITSMIYPAMVTIMSLGVMIILSVFVVPKFATILGGKGESLPAVTQALLNFTDWMQVWWLKIVIGVTVAGISIPLFKTTAPGALIIDWILIKIPLVGSIIRSGIVVNFSRNLGILLRSGVPLSDALTTVRDTLNNAVAAKVLTGSYNSIMAGEGMADSLRNAESVFPPMVAEMVSTGEETGEMEEVLRLTAQIYQKMLESFVKRMNAMIEPLLIIVMGGMVGFVIMALMAGVMSMY